MAESGYGGFTLAGRPLALPMAALREVVPARPWLPLPCAAAGVLGGIELRGVMVPVLDLRAVVGFDEADVAAVGARVDTASRASVVVMAHGGRRLGLLADRIGSIFQASDDGLHRISGGTGTTGRGLFAGSVCGSEDGTLNCVLDAEMLAALPEVPWADDIAPARADGADDDGAADAADAAAAAPTPLLLFRCGELRLAIDAVAVQCTLARPRVEASCLALDPCCGVLEHAGRRVPALDTLQVCGLGRLDRGRPTQALLLRVPEGDVALLVHEVLDIVPGAPHACMALPDFALVRPELFAGAITSSPRQEDSADAAPTLVLDASALLGSPLLADWARTQSDPTGNASRAASGAVPGTACGTPHDGRGAGTAGQRAMLTYELLGVVATPLAQVLEILAHRPDAARVDHGEVLLGLTTTRGRTLPVYCLRRLAGAAAAPANDQARVLVVDCDGAWVGFAVPALRAIEAAHWEPAVPARALGACDALGTPQASQPLALVGRGAQARMLRVLDLEHLARGLQSRAFAA